MTQVQFTAPSKELHVANRELGTIEEINDAGDVVSQCGLGDGVMIEAFCTNQGRRCLCREEVGSRDRGWD
jgi:hypothetical protein